MRTLIAAVAATLLILPNALAQEPTPADASVLPEPVAVEGSVIEEGAVYADAIECCPICVSNHRIGLSARRAYRCQSSVPVTMCVKNPADCCHYAVEFCLPCCCVGEARLCSAECGLLGRGVVTYQWDCGLCAKVIFRARGDVVIHYTM